MIDDEGNDAMSHKSVIDNIYARLAEGDFAPIFEILAEDAPWVEAENIPYSPGAPLVGHDAVQKGVFDALARDFKDFHINVLRVIEGDDVVLVEGRYVGTTVGGVDLDTIFAHVWTFDGERVVHFQQYSDTWQWRRVLGTPD